MAILRYITPILLAVTLSGCYEEFTPGIDTAPVLCLNSLIKAGEPIEVEVSHTWLFDDEASEYDHAVSDAEVTVIVNGQAVGQEYLPREGDRIQIVAQSPTYGMAAAEVVVPYATPIGRVRVTPSVTDMWTGDEDTYQWAMLADIYFNLSIEMDIDDPAGTDNYYRFGYNWFSGSTDNGLPDDIFGASVRPPLSIGRLEYDAEPIFKEHIGVFETVMGNGDDTDFDLFTDRQFAGSRYTLHLNFTDNQYSVKSPSYDESLLDCGINLYLTSVSQSYYNWVVYKWCVDEGVLGDMADLGLAESQWGYSNVSTGAGVVAASSTAVYTVSLRDFLESTLRRQP